MVMEYPLHVQPHSQVPPQLFATQKLHPGNETIHVHIVVKMLVLWCVKDCWYQSSWA